MTAKYTSPNQFAGMLEKRAKELTGLAKRITDSSDDVHAGNSVYEAVRYLERAAYALRAKK